MNLVDLGGKRPVLAPDSFVAPDAVLIGDVELAEGASVWFKSVLRGDEDRIRIGPGCNVQDGCVLHTDRGLELRLGAEVTVGHMAMLHGCHIAEGSLVGIRAVVLNGARVGPRCLIGAGALVPEGKEIPEASLVMGVPGRVVRKLTADDFERMEYSARHYRQKAQIYRDLF